MCDVYDSDSDIEDDNISDKVDVNKTSKIFIDFLKDSSRLHDKFVFALIIHGRIDSKIVDKVEENLFNIQLFNLMNKDKCIYCGYFVRVLGHCYYHMDLLDNKYLFNDANKKINRLNDEERTLLKLSLLLIFCL